MDAELDTDDGLEDHCAICHQRGFLICCDQCSAVYHLACVRLTDVPEGEWKCPACLARPPALPASHLPASLAAAVGVAKPALGGGVGSLGGGLGGGGNGRTRLPPPMPPPPPPQSLPPQRLTGPPRMSAAAVGGLSAFRPPPPRAPPYYGAPSRYVAEPIMAPNDL